MHRAFFFYSFSRRVRETCYPGDHFLHYIVAGRSRVGVAGPESIISGAILVSFYPSGACESLPQVLVFMRFGVTVKIRPAARALFGEAADRLSVDDTIGLVEYWQHECECPPKVSLRRFHSPYCSSLSPTRCRKAI